VQLSFSPSKDKPKYPQLTKFLRDKLKDLKKDGSVLEAFFKATGAPGSKFEQGVVWSNPPLLQIMPAAGGDVVGYAGEGRLILNQVLADSYELLTSGEGGKGCACQTTTRGNWDVVEIAIVRGLALWGCDLAKVSQANDDWDKRADQFVDAVFGTNRKDADYR
jgi:hypothetical protein